MWAPLVQPSNFASADASASPALQARSPHQRVYSYNRPLDQMTEAAIRADAEVFSEL